MGELPPANGRITRVVQSLSSMPVELIQNILEDLPFHRVLEISCASTATPQLIGAIKTSPAWSWLFQEEHARLQDLWTSLNRLSWLWCKEPIMHVKPLCEQLQLSSSHQELKQNSAQHPVELLECHFLWSFLQFIGVEPFTAGKALNGLTFSQLEAVCKFLPCEAITNLQAAQSLGKTERTEGHSSRTPTDTDISNRARAVQAHKWTADAAAIFLPVLGQAHRRMIEDKSAELIRLAALYEAFPTELRTPRAPQTPRPNASHIPLKLRIDAARILVKPIRSPHRTWTKTKSSCLPRELHQFKRPHPVLVPYDWCFRLFNSVVTNHPVPQDDKAGTIYPEHLIPHLRLALQGVASIYRHGGEESDLMRCYDPLTIYATHAQYNKSNSALPSPPAELDWLESFVKCVKWMKQTKVGVLPKLLLDPEDIKEFIETEPAEVVAKQLQVDSKIAVEASSKSIPSLAALYMPSFSSTRAREVAALMWPNVDIATKQLLYEEMLKKIKRGLEKPPPSPVHEDGQDLSSLEIKDGPSASKIKKMTRRERHMEVARDAKPCYICRMRTDASNCHHIFKSMCESCGEFNLAGSRLSLPDKLRLDGKVALVTGARINLGFHTAMRLLRCGARVVATTRYPRDALKRYRVEPDFDTWAGRLRIVGADFRAARDAFELVRVVRDIVKEWGGKLDILINNAAQTLTDSIEKEQQAVGREALLLGQSNGRLDRLLPGGDYYHARVRGGSSGALEGVPSGMMESATPGGESSSGAGAVTSNSGTPGLDLTTPSAPSSWVQSLTDIPYEDIITAHSVNTFVPLILIRELLPLMSGVPQEGQSFYIRPVAGYIINVSSREGIFERTPESSAKNGRHVHTNMSKAGLNMITETEARTAYHEHRVSMNTVDPGYMSAAPEFEQAYGGERPIGWEDGAGRVLWPIAFSQAREPPELVAPIWGRFLKHYGAVRVDTRFGRG